MHANITRTPEFCWRRTECMVYRRMCQFSVVMYVRVKFFPQFFEIVKVCAVVDVCSASCCHCM